MLVMCVAGLASPLAMAGLAGAMAYESMGRHGRRAGSIVGAVLAWVALLVVLSGSSVG